LTATETSAGGAPDYLTVRAANGGTIDLRNVTTAGLTSGESTDRLRFLIEDGPNGNGAIRLDSLQTGTQLQFDVRVTNFQLPSLPSLDNSDIIVANGGSIVAANLAAVTKSVITLTGSGALQVGPPSGGLSNVDGSRFYIRDGATFDEVTDTIYTGTFSRNIMGEFIVESKGVDGLGTGSLLDLQSLTQLSATETSAGGGPNYLTIHAADGGTIDLRNVTTAGLTGSESKDRLRFLIEGGPNGNGNIRLDGLQTGSQIRLDVQAGGIATIGDFTSGGRVDITVAGPAFPSPRGILQSNGGLTLDTTSTLTLHGGGTLRLAGNLGLTTQTESNFSTDAGLIQMEGTEMQLLEVGGEDLGVAGSTTGNFGIGRLSVGTPSQSTTVVLLDGADNGNRGPGSDPEALYLFGMDGQDGLNIELNSVVALYGVQAYAFDAATGQQVHLNSLFPAGTNEIAYGQGFLRLIEIIDGDYNADGAVSAADYVSWRANGGTQAGYDLWRANFGASIGSQSSSSAVSTAAAPEPAALFLTIVQVVMSACIFRRRSNTT
jgi:hypothetical protein